MTLDRSHHLQSMDGLVSRSLLGIAIFGNLLNHWIPCCQAKKIGRLECAACRLLEADSWVSPSELCPRRGMLPINFRRSGVTLSVHRRNNPSTAVATIALAQLGTPKEDQGRALTP